MKKIASFISLTVLVFTLMQSGVHAIDPYRGACEPGSDKSVCTTQVVDPISGVDSVIPKIANVIASVAGIIAIVIIMMSGLTLITSTGDSAKITQARNSIIYACVGIIVIIASRVIVGFIMRYL